MPGSPCTTEEFPVDFVRRGDPGAVSPPPPNKSSPGSRRFVSPAARSPSPTRLLPPLPASSVSELPPL